MEDITEQKACLTGKKFLIWQKIWKEIPEMTEISWFSKIFQIFQEISDIKCEGPLFKYSSKWESFGCSSLR